MSRRWSSLLVIFSLTLACGDSGSGTNSNGETSETSETSSAPSTSETAGETGVAARPNWHEDVAPLVAEHCQGCHKTGGIAPFTLESYAEASPWAPVIADVTEAGDMPPWHALTTDQCTPALPYKHDAQLSPETITTLSPGETMLRRRSSRSPASRISSVLPTNGSSTGVTPRTSVRRRAVVDSGVSAKMSAEGAKAETMRAVQPLSVSTMIEVHFSNRAT